ncbi:MAG: mechanosensitive ion channel family protein [Pedobacter sp.]|nr:MAG: mechanosensitive ion channel family protein [Pedobacter sp.]
MVEIADKKEIIFYDKAYNWVLDHGPNVLLGIALLFVGLWLIRLFSRLLHSGMDKHEFDPSLKPFLVSLILTGARILLIISVMQVLGIEMTIFVTILGAMSVAVGLALSGTLQNFASGVLILILKPFKVGDNIVAQGQEGTVTSIQIFYTIVTTFDNRTVVLPNSKLSNEVIVNISGKGVRRMDVDLKVSYKAEYIAVHKIISETISQSSDMLKKPEKRIGISVFGDEFYTVSISVWIKAHGFNDTKLKFQEHLLNNIKEAKISMGK